MKRLIFAAAIMFAAALSIGALAAPPAAKPPPLVKSAHAVDLADNRPVVDLSDDLTAYQGGVPQEDGTSWYVLTVANTSTSPASRVLQATEAPGASIQFFPVGTRPNIVQVVSSEPRVVVSDAGQYVRRGVKVTVPPSVSAAIAVRLENASNPPALLAWTEPTLAAQHRRLAIFIAAVAGLIAAATLITGGLAVMTGHAAPRWAALALLAVLMARLANTGMFDTSLATAVGGPYGLTAAFAGLALAAGLCLVDSIMPFAGVWPKYKRQIDWVLYGIIGVSILAYLGVPGATLLVEAVVLFGTSAIAAWLVHRGRHGVRAARVVSPSATIFALVALATAVASVGGFADNFTAPAVVGGFAAAGAMLLALAIVAGEGLVSVAHWRLAIANIGHHDGGELPPPHADTAPATAAPAPQDLAALAAIGASHQGVFDLDLRKMVVNLSKEAATLIGFKGKPQQFKHIDWIARIHPDDRDIYTQAVEDFSAHTGLAFRIEFRVKSEAGRYPWFELRATMLGDKPPAVRCLGLMADVTTRKEAEPTAPAERPLRDALTGLGNRTALMEDFAHVSLNAVVFAVLDVDRFKAIHASLGDAGADVVLTKIAERLTGRFTPEAQIYRLGGDSFAVLFANTNIDAAAIGTALAETCAPVHSIDGRNVFAPASVGVALGRDASSAQELLKNTELALTQAKRQGGACARVYNGEMESAADSVVLESELRRALDEDQLDVFYQPIVRLADRTVVGFEALLRWHHPTKGLVVPDDFIAHSEETGLIVPLGRFALERAARELANWQRFFPLDPPLFISVNLSRRQLVDGEFETALRNVFAAERIARGTLKLELTESAVAGGDDTKATLDRLRALGAGIAIDDFGTGLSNFSQLKELPFDTLKIDRSFLARHSGQDEKDAAVLRSIVALARELGRGVIVEGVETDHDAQWVTGLGCDYAQGFRFSQPLPASEALNYLAMHFDEKTSVPSGATGVGR
jgi:diguanylate cyclase (GGDEF)-like protein